MDMSSMSMSGMATSVSNAASSTLSGMSMATSTAMGTSSSAALMGMEEMAMTFFASTNTPLYSRSWIPNSAGHYAGTCIFLIVLATIFRALLAIRVNLFEFLAALKGRQAKNAVYAYGADENFTTRPWRANEAVLLAFTDALIAGIGYLLMIAVMTMNVGYFLSILGGVFLGSLIFGHFLTHTAAAH